MSQSQEAAIEQYPHGRGYGQDYMRGGEVQGGYGYAEREEYAKSRGELDDPESDDGAARRRGDSGQGQQLPS